MTDESAKYLKQIEDLRKENELLWDSQAKYNLLNDMFTDLLKLQELPEIYKFIARSLHKHFPNGLVLYISIDEAANETCFEHVEGLDNALLKKILSISSFNPIGRKYKLLPNFNDHFRSGKLVEFTDGLAEFSGTEFPSLIARSIEKIIGLNKIYTIGIVKDESLLAAIHFFMFSKSEINDIPFVETFVRHAGIILQKKIAEIALLKSEAKTKAILHTIPDMMFILNSEGILKDFYLPENVSSDFLPNDFLGRKFQEVIPPDIASGFLPIFHKALSSKQMQLFEFSMQLNDVIHYFEARTISYEADKVLSIVRDITERHISEQTIKQQNSELKNLNADKDRFLQILSHDLRSPFQTLLGFSDLLLRNVRSFDIDKIENQLRQIHQTSFQTYNLLDDLLLWTKAQSGKLPFEPKSVNLQEMCDEVVVNFTTNFKNITINSFHSESITLMVDKNMIKTVIRNLLSNAIKFSNQDGKIDIYTIREKDSVIITVSDNGVGIQKENLSRLWKYNKPFSTKGTADEKGTGFGLLLCKEFVEKHGGKIWVESEVGKGSDFKFSLPVSR